MKDWVQGFAIFLKWSCGQRIKVLLIMVNLVPEIPRSHVLQTVDPGLDGEHVGAGVPGQEQESVQHVPVLLQVAIYTCFIDGKLVLFSNKKGQFVTFTSVT